MRSHINDIVSLIDSVLGPDDNGPVPTHFLGSVSSVHHNRVMDRPTWPDIQTFGPPTPRNRSTRGQYSVRGLNSLTLGDLERHLGGRMERNLTNNTKVARDYDGNLIVILHATRIITYQREADGEITMNLNSGGWQTVTTKQRMNALLPSRYRIFSRDWKWYVQVGPFDGGDTLDFFDGIKLFTGER